MDPKWTQNEPKTEPKWTRHVPKSTKITQHEQKSLNMSKNQNGPKWS